MITLGSAAFATLTNQGVFQSPACKRHDVKHIEGAVAAVIFDFDGTLTCTPGDRADRRTKMSELAARASMLGPWLKALREADVLIGILSKSTTETVTSALEAAGLRDAFNGPIVGKAHGFDGKVGFINEMCCEGGALEHLGTMGIHRVLLVDDDTNELLMAREAGAQTYPAPEEGGLQVDDFGQIFAALTISEPPVFYESDEIQCIFARGLIGRSRSLPEEPTQVMVPLDEGLRISQHYEVDQQKILGQGSFGWIRPGIHSSSGKEIALKFVRKSANVKHYVKNFVEDDMWTFLLKMSLNHAHTNVLKYFDFFIGPTILYTIMEQLTGQDVLIYLKEQSPITELRCQNMLFQLISALNHIHGVMDIGLIHRDVKLENMRFRTAASDTLVLVDFGLSCAALPDQERRRVVGTLPYMAPEVFTRRYTTKVDIWSTGVLLYIVLTGALPWQDNPWQVPVTEQDSETIVDLAVEGCKAVHSPDAAVDLLKGLLVIDPSMRMTAAQALQHEWVYKGGTFASNESDIGRRLSSRHDQFVQPKRAGRAGEDALTGTSGHKSMEGVFAEFMTMSEEPSGGGLPGGLPTVMDL